MDLEDFELDLITVENSDGSIGGGMLYDDSGSEKSLSDDIMSFLNGLDKGEYLSYRIPGTLTMSKN